MGERRGGAGSGCPAEVRRSLSRGAANKLPRRRRPQVPQQGPRVAAQHIIIKQRCRAQRSSSPKASAAPSESGPPKVTGLDSRLHTNKPLTGTLAAAAAYRWFCPNCMGSRS